MKKTVPTMKTAPVIKNKKMKLYKERIRVLTPTDLKLVEGGQGNLTCDTHSCESRCPIETCT